MINISINVIQCNSLIFQAIVLKGGCMIQKQAIVSVPQTIVCHSTRHGNNVHYGMEALPLMKG